LLSQIIVTLYESEGVRTSYLICVHYYSALNLKCT